MLSANPEPRTPVSPTLPTTQLQTKRLVGSQHSGPVTPPALFFGVSAPDLRHSLQEQAVTLHIWSTDNPVHSPRVQHIRNTQTVSRLVSCV